MTRTPTRAGGGVQSHQREDCEAKEAHCVHITAAEEVAIKVAVLSAGGTQCELQGFRTRADRKNAIVQFSGAGRAHHEYVSDSRAPERKVLHAP